MFKTAEELKTFIIWAKNNKIKRVKVGTTEFEVSDLAFISELNAPSSQENPIEQTELAQDAQSEEEDLQFWSAR